MIEKSRLCALGPCRITEKSPYGVCGADILTMRHPDALKLIKELIEEMK